MKNPLRLQRYYRLSRFIFLLVLFFTLSVAAHAVTKTSTGSGNWNNGNTWSPSGVPATGDNVIILAGHTVTINTNTTGISSLTIQGTLIIGNNNTNRSVTVSGTITIGSSGIFETAGNGGNSIYLGGNLVNDGVFDMKLGSATAELIFNGSSNQYLSGNGSVTDVDGITVNNTGAFLQNIVEIQPTVFTASSGFLTLTKGIIKMSGTYSLSNTFFNTASPVIHSDEGVWLNNPNVTVTAQNGDTRLYGFLRISAGSYNIGIGADWWLYYYSGATVIIDGGSLTISGAFCGATTSQTINYTQQGGTVTVNTAGNNYSVASFEIWNTASTFTMSGGFIVLQQPATAFTDYVNYSTSSSVTGGILQAGNASTPASSVFWFNSTPALYDLVINTQNVQQFQLRSSTTVQHDLTINGTLDAATKDVSVTVGHDFVNNGQFLPGNTAAVIFNGSTAQTIRGTQPVQFSNLTLSNTGGGVTLQTGVQVSGTASFSNGILYTSSSYPLAFADNAIASGANNNGSNPSYVSGPVSKTGNDAFIFPVGKAGAGYHPCSISAPSQTSDVFTAEYMRSSAAALGPLSAGNLYQVSNCDYWNINRTVGTSAVNVTLSWNGFSNCNAAAYVTQLSSLVVAHFDGATWNNDGANSYTGTVSSGTVTWNNVAAFSPFALGSNSPSTNPLPVTFAFIKAYAAGAANKIEWTNLTETGLKAYVLQKSVDGALFAALDTINARSNNNDRQDYAAIDPHPEGNVCWYRVLAIAQDGGKTYSVTVRVDRAKGQSLWTVYPNPVTNRQLNLQVQDGRAGEVTISLLNLAGQSLLTAKNYVPAGTVTLPLLLPATIKPGMYLLKLGRSGQETSLKLLVQ